jgi:imidazolonepropionase-like amidohydrolase
MKSLAHCLLAALWLTISSAAASATESWALVGITLIDPGRALVQPGATMLVEGERIAAVFSGDEQMLPPGTLIHDAHERFVIPGLIESHVHMTPLFTRSELAMNAELARMLRGGIVAARDMAGDARVLGMARRRIQAGEIEGPDLYFSVVMGSSAFAQADFRMSRSALGFAPGTVPWSQAIDADTDLVLAVARAAGTHASGIKLYADLDAALIRGLSKAARAQGLKVWAHATVFPNRPIEVVRAGVEVISHACGLAWQDSNLDPATIEAVSIHNRPRFDPARVQPDSPEMLALFAEMVRRGTVLDPTLTNHARPGDDEFGCTPELTLALTRSAVQTGVPIVAGTDYIAPPDDPHPALLHEIEYLVEHDVLDPSAAIVAATLNAARVLDLEHELGTIEAGKLASFVVLKANPLEDIRALREIEMVVKRGRQHPAIH